MNTPQTLALEESGAEKGRAEPGEGRFATWISLALVVACFGWLLHWSWGKWTDAHIDFGNELYIAWQLLEGRSLYADMAHRNGPFSHHLNAFWFALFGVSIRTLVWCNLAILLGISGMLYRIFRLACGRLTATVVVCFFFTVFAFSQYGLIGNFNYVTPYQHFQTHGMALSLAMILALAEARRRGASDRSSAPSSVQGLVWAVVAGVCFGALFLGKVEIFVPAALCAVFGLAVLMGPGPGTEVIARRSWLLLGFAGGALVVLALCFLLLTSRMSAGDAWLGMSGNWAYLGESLLSDRFYVAGAGFDDFWGNSGTVLLRFGVLALFALALGVLDRLLPRARALPWSVVLGLGIFVALRAADPYVPWTELPRALPVTTALLATALWLPGLRRHLDSRAQEHWLPLALLSIFAIGLLGKMLLNARVGHYGFVLAMPATLLLLAALLALLPGLLAKRYAGGGLMVVLAVGAIAAAAVHFWSATDQLYSRKDFQLGRGPDAITVESPNFMARGLVVSRTLETLEELMDEDDTLLVLPEGIGINYWLRRQNPTPYHLFLPTEMQAFGGDDAMLERIESHPPDFIVLAHRGHLEFGVGPFGIDPRNGRALMEWVRTHYRVVTRLGAPPFRTRHFGTLILRRSQLAGAPAPRSDSVGTRTRTGTGTETEGGAVRAQ